MLKRFLAIVSLLVVAAPAFAQQPPAQPLTFYYDYTVKPGKEAAFLELVKTVGQPVRDKLMADGVVLAWGIDVPLLTVPGTATHSIWYSVADYAGVQKVDDAMRAQRKKLADDEAARKVARGATTEERVIDVFDGSKSHFYLTRDLVSAVTPAPPAGVLPYTRYNFVKVHPGKGPDYRAAWEKYNKPVFDKLLADGVILGYGFALEEVKTAGEFTHFVWYAAKDMAAFDKQRDAFMADRNRRSQEERDGIAALFLSLSDPDAARSIIVRAIMFHVAGQK
jgi:hypothetical protein